jgi:uncharacterized protein
LNLDASFEIYRAPLWLPNGNLQTIWPLAIKGALPPYRRERWITPDNDFIDLDWIEPSSSANFAPTVVLFHGLEGSSASHYARALMHAVNRRGWRGVVVHFRGCSGEPNRLLRSYHSGETTDLDWILRRLREVYGAEIYVCGVSLGGNALLKWLGEQGDKAAHVIKVAAAISAPLDLAAASRTLAKGFNRIYTNNFLQTLVPRALAKANRFPGVVDITHLTKAKTLADFDEAFIAPVFGFANAQDYYSKSSSGQFLSEIRTPTLVLNAANDPFLPHSALPEQREVSPSVTLQITSAGGHVGFVSDGPPGNIQWLPQRILNYFTTQMTSDLRIQ